MAMVTLTSNYSTNLSQSLHFEKNNGSHRDASSSTFLRGAEEHNVLKSSRELTPNIISENEHHYPGRKKEDGEIGVFGAEKYFNGGIDVDNARATKIHAKKLECVKDERVVNLEPIKPVIHHGTPSVRSESSWNSQSALLQSVMRNSPRAKPSKVNGKSFLSFLAACNCYCSDRNSVDIEVGEISFKRPANGEVVQGKQNKSAASKKGSLEVNKPSAEPWIKEDLFTFPTMNSTAGIRPVKVPLQGEVDEFGRKSLEVFGSPELGRRHKSLNLERRLKMLSWDHATRKVDETENSKANCNDTESDASSDLFEIESLTGKANPFVSRRASDAAASGCATPTTCYAPSEASIEWSVVTSSAVDFSVLSDYEERRPSITLPSPVGTFSTTTNGTTTNNKEFQRPHSNIGLLGCNSQKAVKIAGDASKTNEKAGVKIAGDASKTNEKAGLDPRMSRASDSFVPATRFRAEPKLANAFEPTQTPRILATRSLPLPHSHSPQASRLLYIQ